MSATEPARRNRSRDEKMAGVFKTCVELNKEKSAINGIILNPNERKESQKAFLKKMIEIENLSGTKRIMNQRPIEYPLPHNMETSVYRNDFYSTESTAKKNLRVPKFNREIEANRIFSDVKAKNNYPINSITTCHQDYRNQKSHSVYNELKRPELKIM